MSVSTKGFGGEESQAGKPAALTTKVNGARLVGVNLIDHVLEFAIGWVLAERAHDLAEFFGRDFAYMAGNPLRQLNSDGLQNHGQRKEGREGGREEAKAGETARILSRESDNTERKRESYHHHLCPGIKH